MPEILHSRSRFAFTLVELLIVIVILGVVTAASIPVVAPALASRGVREAGRIINAHLGSAQALAMANGRSAGIWIERLPSETTGALDLYLAEVPAPYAGDSTTSRAMLSSSATVTTVQLGSDIGWYNLPLKPGDLIRFNYGGQYYQFTGKSADPSTGSLSDATVESPTGSGNYVLKGDNTLHFQIVPAAAGASFNFPPAASSAAGWSVPYQILRQPTRSIGGSVSLPTGTAIDLIYSGPSADKFVDRLPTMPTNLQTKYPTDKQPIIITFSRTGALERVYMMGQIMNVNEPLYLLIGKREKLFNTESDNSKRNLAELENVWVAINPQTGLATTAEVASNGGSGSSTDLKAARAYAQSAQAMGGK